MADLASSQALSDAAHGATNTTEVLYLVARHFISSFIDLLHSSVTTDAQLTYTSKLSSGSSIGKHARHLADHYRLLFEGTARSRGAGSESPLEVNYDQRTRNLAAETSHAACVDAFEQLRAQLATVTGEGKAVDAAREVRLHATTPFEVDVASSFGRELWFASFHAVHHFALIRVIAAEQGIELPDEFGVAPATLVHRKESEGESGPASKPAKL